MPCAPPTSLNQLVHKSNAKHVIDAENVMTQARSLCNKLSITGGAKIRAVGKLDVRIIGYLLKKGKDLGGKEYGSTTEIAEVFLEDISKVAGKKIPFSSEAGDAVSASSGQGAASTSSGGTVLHQPCKAFSRCSPRCIKHSIVDLQQVPSWLNTALVRQRSGKSRNTTATPLT